MLLYDAFFSKSRLFMWPEEERRLKRSDVERYRWKVLLYGAAGLMWCRWGGYDPCSTTREEHDIEVEGALLSTQCKRIKKKHKDGRLEKKLDGRLERRLGEETTQREADNNFHFIHHPKKVHNHASYKLQVTTTTQLPTTQSNNYPLHNLITTHYHHSHNWNTCKYKRKYK